MSEKFCPVIDLVLTGIEKEGGLFLRTTPIWCDPVVSGSVTMKIGSRGIKVTNEEIEWCYLFLFTTSDDSALEVEMTSTLWNLHRKLLPESPDMSLRKFYEHYFEKCDKVKIEEIINAMRLL